MSDFVPSLTVDNCIKALGDFIAPFMRGGLVVRGQENRVPLPSPPTCVLTEMLTVRLGQPITTQPDDPDDQRLIMRGPTQIDVQADFYGRVAGDVSEAVRVAFESQWAATQFPESIKPLYASQGNQGPLVTGEQQYENRWTVTLSIQYNPLVTVPMQSMTTADVTGLVAVDVEYIL